MPPSTTLIRPPTLLTSTSVSTSPPSPTFTHPPLTFLTGTWHITHSTLPMWRSKRNVTITYTSLAPSTSTNPSPPTAPSTASTAPASAPLPQLDDHVQYKSAEGGKTHSIRGVDTACGEDSGVWEWRGRNWLMLVRSRWEVVGWGPRGARGGEGEEAEGGDEEGAKEECEGGEGEGKEGKEEGVREEWMVTYFAKTIFTPAGIDVYSTRKEGLGEGTLRAIMEGLRGWDGEAFGKLVEGVFEVVRD